MKFSVIIPTCHRDDALALCLDRLAPGKQTLPAEDYEVIVTDDGSRSTAEAMLRAKYPWAKWVAGPRKGPAANRNNGAKHSCGEWLAFTDDDCVPDLHWLASFAKAAAANPAVRVLDGLVYADRPKQSLGETSPTKDTGGQLWSCNFAIRRELFAAMRGFDERFPYAAMEDCDLALRLKKAGEATVFVREASVCHPWRPKVGWAGHKKHQASHWIYLAIHPEERGNLTPKFFVEASALKMIRETLPGVVQFRGRGLGKALLEHAFWLQTAWLLCWKKFPEKTSDPKPSAAAAAASRPAA